MASGNSQSSCSASSRPIVFLPSIRYGSLSVEQLNQPRSRSPCVTSLPQSSIWQSPFVLDQERTQIPLAREFFQREKRSHRLAERNNAGDIFIGQQLAIAPQVPRTITQRAARKLLAQALQVITHEQRFAGGGKVVQRARRHALAGGAAFKMGDVACVRACHRRNGATSSRKRGQQTYVAVERLDHCAGVVGVREYAYADQASGRTAESESIVRDVVTLEFLPAAQHFGA